MRPAAAASNRRRHRSLPSTASPVATVVGRCQPTSSADGRCRPSSAAEDSVIVSCGMTEGEERGTTRARDCESIPGFIREEMVIGNGFTQRCGYF